VSSIVLQEKMLYVMHFQKNGFKILTLEIIRGWKWN